MQKTILIIEDNQDIRENTAELLELEGYQLITADNGSAGIRQAQTYLPDLVICDVLMKEADGYTVFRTMLEESSTRDIPFIFVTAKSETADQAIAMAIGTCDYLIKPFDEKYLFECVKRLLTSSSGSREA